MNADASCRRHARAAPIADELASSTEQHPKVKRHLRDATSLPAAAIVRDVQVIIGVDGLTCRLEMEKRHSEIHQSAVLRYRRLYTAAVTCVKKLAIMNVHLMNRASAYRQRVLEAVRS